MFCSKLAPVLRAGGSVQPNQSHWSTAVSGTAWIVLPPFGARCGTSVGPHPAIRLHVYAIEVNIGICGGFVRPEFIEFRTATVHTAIIGGSPSSSAYCRTNSTESAAVGVAAHFQE